MKKEKENQGDDRKPKYEKYRLARRSFDLQDFGAYASIFGFFITLTIWSFDIVQNPRFEKILLVSVVLASVSVFYLVWRRFAHETSIRRFIEAEYEGTLEAIEDIIPGILDSSLQNKKISRIKKVFYIDSDASAYTSTDIAFKTLGNSLTFLRFNIDADGTARPVKFMGEIDLKVRVSDNHKFRPRYIASVSKETHKSILLFFLPPIPSNTEMNLHISYKWPRFHYDLVALGETIVNTVNKSASDTDLAEIEYEFLASKKLGPLKFAVIEGDNGADLFETERPNERIWRYQVSNVPVNKVRAFSITKTQRR